MKACAAFLNGAESICGCLTGKKRKEKEHKDERNTLLKLFAIYLSTNRQTDRETNKETDAQ